MQKFGGSGMIGAPFVGSTPSARPNTISAEIKKKEKKTQSQIPICIKGNTPKSKEREIVSRIHARIPSEALN